jgi:hypothetical protein
MGRNPLGQRRDLVLRDAPLCDWNSVCKENRCCRLVVKEVRRVGNAQQGIRNRTHGAARKKIEIVSPRGMKRPGRNEADGAFGTQGDTAVKGNDG